MYTTNALFNEGAAKESIELLLGLCRDLTFGKVASQSGWKGLVCPFVLFKKQRRCKVFEERKWFTYTYL